MRKFGILTIISLVPTHDGETLTRLKAIKKEQARKARKKLEVKKTSKGSGQDETDFTSKRKPKTLAHVLKLLIFSLYYEFRTIECYFYYIAG